MLQISIKKTLLAAIQLDKASPVNWKIRQPVAVYRTLFDIIVDLPFSRDRGAEKGSVRYTAKDHFTN